METVLDVRFRPDTQIKFINSIILERANADEINREMGILVSTCHLWMLSDGYKDCENKEHYYIHSYNRGSVIIYETKMPNTKLYGKSIHVNS